MEAISNLIESKYVTDVQGNFILDMYGRRVPLDAPRSPSSDSDAEVEYDTPTTTNSSKQESRLAYHFVFRRSRPSWRPHGGGQWTTGGYSEQDYSSSDGYAAPGCEEVPRHHPRGFEPGSWSRIAHFVWPCLVHE
ncbi:hypothetical protein V2G26_005248 [Clonostachys chloroleuca]